MNSLFPSGGDLSIAPPAGLNQTCAMAKTNDTPNVLPLELGSKTMARLLRLAEACGDSPEKIAASLLRDILADDEALNVMQPSQVSTARH